MKNFVDTFYKKRDGKSKIRDESFTGDMLDLTVTSHGAICDLQDQICFVESCCDNLFHSLNKIYLEYALSVLEYEKNVPSDIVKIVNNYITKIEIYTSNKLDMIVENLEKIKRDTFDNFVPRDVETKDCFRYMKKYHKWLRKKENDVVEMVEDMCAFDNYCFNSEDDDSDDD